MFRIPTAQTRAAGAYQQLTEVCERLRVELLTADQSAPAAAQGWLPRTQLASSVEELVQAESVRIETEHGRAPRTDVAASRLLHHYLWSSSLLFSGVWYLTGEVPRIEPDALWIQSTTGELALRPGGCAPGGEAELRAAVADHVAPVLSAFQPYVRRGRRALWGMAADDLISGIWHLGRNLGEEERSTRIAAAVLPGNTPPFPGAADFFRLPGVEGRTHLTRSRVGCCLKYAIRLADTCVTCPRLDRAERVRRLDLQESPPGAVHVPRLHRRSARQPEPACGAESRPDFGEGRCGPQGLSGEGGASA